jgi:hypothetical protein
MISIIEKQKSAAPDWWMAVPAGERALLRAIARMLRSAKCSQLPEVARAAAKWERGIGCFVKVRLMNARPKGRAVDSRWLKVEGRGEPQKSGELKAEIGAVLAAENAWNAEI